MPRVDTISDGSIVRACRDHDWPIGGDRVNGRFPVTEGMLLRKLSGANLTVKLSPLNRPDIILHLYHENKIGEFIEPLST